MVRLISVFRIRDDVSNLGHRLFSRQNCVKETLPANTVHSITESLPLTKISGSFSVRICREYERLRLFLGLVEVRDIQKEHRLVVG